MFRPFREKFTHLVRTKEGHRVKVEFGDPNASPRPRKEIQNLPHRTLSVGRNSILKGGDVVNWNGIRYLLVDQHTLTVMKRFLAAEITHEVHWERVERAIDPVTRVERSGAPQTLEQNLPVILEPRSSVEDEGFEMAKYRGFTGSDVRQGDLIDGMKVQDVQELFGIKIFQVV